MKSPLTNNNCEKVDEIESSWLIERYGGMGVDVSKYFDGIPFVEIWHDKSSGYKFYHPFNLVGDEFFYEQLGAFDWYYKPWKWEYQIALQYVKKNENVLEIGCGNGDFLLKLKESGVTPNVTGLEFNPEAIRSGKEKGIEIVSDPIEDFAASSDKEFDVVCSFQVLEHICEVYPFLDNKIKTIRRGGKMIIGVPNNDSFYRFKDDGIILNYPPHHQGRWSKESLKGLEKIFNLKLLSIRNEPLQPNSFILYERVFANEIIKNKYIRYIYLRFGGRWLHKKILPFIARFIKGHTILAIFEKQ